jgi:hypothetical protein
MKFQYYTVYKTTNLLNNKYYIGIHATNDLNDGYLGSGKNIKQAIKKYGKEHFKKDILYVYSIKDYTPDKASELMFIKEAELVNSNTLNDSLCYNAMLGGDVNPNMKDTTWAIKDNVIRKIQKTQIKKFKKEGYEIGRYTQYITEGWSPGRAYPITANTIWVTKDNKSKMVKKEELKKYLNEGYTQGRNIQKKIKVHNGKETIMINKPELDYYIKKGYKQGLHYKTVSGFKVARLKELQQSCLHVHSVKIPCT